MKISLLNSKGEIQPQLEDAAKVFKEDNPNITLEVNWFPQAGRLRAASALYASGNPPTMTMLDTGDVEKFKDRILDLSGEKWMADAVAKHRFDKVRRQKLRVPTRHRRLRLYL